MRVPGTPTIPLQDLRARLLRAMAELPSNAALQDDPLSPDVMKWVGDVSALLNATGNLTFMGESQVAINGLTDSKTRLANFHKLRLILQKALSQTELDIAVPGAAAQGAAVPAHGAVDISSPLDAKTMTNAEEIIAAMARANSRPPTSSEAELYQTEAVEFGSGGNERHSGRSQVAGVKGIAAGEGAASAEARPYVAQAVRFSAGGEDRPEVLHQTLLARVAVLEIAVQELRKPTGVGIGHNKPPADEDNFAPVTSDDLDEIDQLISLLKEQPPAPAILPPQIIEQSRVVAKIGAKIAQLADIYAQETTKAAGQETGKRLVQLPFWLGVSSTIAGVAAALQAWISVLPH
ncbi:hypothetical protein [Bradyrhizobium tunisiense]|uniref:hypothetical protein n=1 Tax=Bradyrhizobium tunisiense TaxID=3278709 RepID=UPI0035D595B5